MKNALLDWLRCDWLDLALALVIGVLIAIILFLGASA